MDKFHPYADIAPLLRDASQAPAGEVQVAEVLACMLDDELDVAAAQRRLETFYQGVSEVTDAEQLRHWFKQRQFGSDRAFTATLKHSNIVWVADHQEGLPIVLAVLIMGAARKCGLTAYGVNYPGHFLLRLDTTLVDPLSLQPLPEDKVEGGVGGLRADPESIALRMLNNVKSLAHRQADLAEVLNLLDLQLHIVSSSDGRATLYYEQAEVWLQFGSVSSARTALNRCAEQADDPALARKAQQRLQQLQDEGELRH